MEQEWQERAGELTRMLRKAVLFEEPGLRPEELLEPWLEELLPGQGEAVTKAFLDSLPEIRARLWEDVQAAWEGDPAASGEREVLLAYPGMRAVTAYRLAHRLWELGVPLLPRLMTEHAHSRTGIDIHPGAKIGRHFFIDHGTGVVIGETTVVGDHVKLYQGVTLGGLSTRGGQSLRGLKRHPTLEDRVTVYANAAILGGDTVIGHDCVIGANAFVTESVPPCTTVRMKDPELHFQTRDCGR